jgi:hypothetical protein
VFRNNNIEMFKKWIDKIKNKKGNGKDLNQLLDNPDDFGGTNNNRRMSVPVNPKKSFFKRNRPAIPEEGVSKHEETKEDEGALELENEEEIKLPPDFAQKLMKLEI